MKESAALGIGRPQYSSSPRAATRHPRQSSQAAYNVFDGPQIQVFKEAFSLMDADNDGVITESDLKNLLASLGQTPSPALLASLLSSRPSPTPSSSSPNPYLAPGSTPTPITFSLFLTMMAEHLSEMDTETDLVEAFASFDENDSGKIPGRELTKWLAEVGDKMSDEEIRRLLDGPFTDRNGMFDYRKFCATLRVTDVEASIGGGGETSPRFK